MSIAGNEDTSMTFNLKTLIVGFIASLTLSACGASQAPEELIIGDWVQTKSVSIDDSGVSLDISDSTIRYLSDGTSQSSARLKIGNVPEALSTYQVDTAGTWRIEDAALIEGVTTAIVKSTSGNPQAAGIARQMQETIISAEETSAEILALTKTQMTLREAETNYVIRFEKR